jgi:gliding motility-associated-like protein
VLGALSAPVPGVRAAEPPKVVVIVGPVGGTTPSYRADADKAAAEALNYTPNVVKIYSPNATWAAVKPALQGASIVIYMGHGNGFPSPYTSSPAPERQNGLGLNPTAGANDTSTKYYGESVIASEVDLAPNAVVILGHLCYASGSSEPGNADPSQSVAQQRVDNFAAGFIAAGARAVFAEAYSGAAAGYVRALFTSHGTIGDIWANAPSRQNNAYSFPSTRSPGMTVQMDPDAKSGKYYRAVTGDMSLSADSVIGSGGSTPVTNPNPIANPTPTPTPKPTPAPTAAPTPTPTSDPLEPSVGSGAQVGGMLTSMSAPLVFSPNGDGRQDTFAIKAKLAAKAAWAVTVTDAGGTIFDSASGNSDNIALNWDGQSAGARMADGTYTYRIIAADLQGGTLERTGSVRIDTVPPDLTQPIPDGMLGSLSPNGDGANDTWTGSFSMNEPGTLEATVVSNQGGVLVRHLTGTVTNGSGTLTWDGRTDRGSGVADGIYNLVVIGRDQAGNPGVAQGLALSLYRAVAKVAVAPAIFYPQDRDALAPSTRLGFTLTAPATVTWTINDESGAIVATKYVSTALPAGNFAWVWKGTDGAARLLPPGAYTATLTATNGTLATTSRTALTVAAFAIGTSSPAVARGESVTITAISAEALAAAPTVTIAQPGLKPRTVSMVKASGTNAWRVTTKLSASGKSGALTLTVSGTDTARGRNAATSTVPLR